MFGLLKRLLSVRPAVDDRLLTILGETRLFENLSLADIEELAERVETRNYLPGEIIFQRGAPGDGLYIVDRGSVEIFLEESAARPLAILRDREYFGEMALIDESGTRTASARARGEATCLFLSRDDFENLLSSSHVVAARMLYQLCRVLSRRLGRTSRLAAGIAEPEDRAPRHRPESAPAALPPLPR